MSGLYGWACRSSTCPHGANPTLYSRSVDFFGHCAAPEAPDVPMLCHRGTGIKGDSGGPLVYKGRIVGVHAGVGSGYTAHADVTLSDAYAWIMNTTKDLSPN